MGDRRIAGAEDHVARDVDAELLFELRLNIDRAEDAEAFGLQRGLQSSNNLLEGAVGGHDVAVSGVVEVLHGVFPSRYTLPLCPCAGCSPGCSPPPRWSGRRSTCGRAI